jgi:hypothetical protein
MMLLMKVVRRRILPERLFGSRAAVIVAATVKFNHLS